MIDSVLDEDFLDHPLKYKKLGELVHLEEKYYNREMDINALNSLCLIYATLVEYYDLKKDPIKNYFLEKIQEVTGNKSSLKILANKKERSAPIKDFSTPSSQEHKKLAPNKIGDEPGFGGSSRSKINKNLDYQSRKDIRAKNLDFTLKLDEENTRNEKIPITAVVTGFSAAHDRNDKTVLDNLSEQEKSIQEKLERRKKSSFQRSIENTKLEDFNNSYIFKSKTSIFPSKAS